jgi:hypothetical protein
VTGAGDVQALHVVGDGLHQQPGAVPGGSPAADGQDAHRQLGRVALVAYDAVSRVRHSFERVDDDLVNNCTVEPGGSPAARVHPRQTETWSVVEAAYACGSA